MSMDWLLKSIAGKWAESHCWWDMVHDEGRPMFLRKDGLVVYLCGEVWKIKLGSFLPDVDRVFADPEVAVNFANNIIPLGEEEDYDKLRARNRRWAIHLLKKRS